MNLAAKTLRIILQIVCVYIISTVIIYYFSDYSIFLPPKASYKDSDKIIKITVSNGNKISAYYLSNPDAKYVILYSHGNSEDMLQNDAFLRTLHAWGFAVMAYDYEGYGTSEGKPSEKATYRDISAVYEYLIHKKKYAPQQIILYGRSLGSGPTIELAIKQDVAGVILEGAFVSAYRVVTYWPIFALDKFNNISKINQIRVPLLLIHGTDDEVIPFWHANALYSAYIGTKEHLWIKDGLHNDPNYLRAEYKQALFIYLDLLAK